MGSDNAPTVANYSCRMKDRPRMFDQTDVKEMALNEK